MRQSLMLNINIRVHMSTSQAPPDSNLHIVWPLVLEAVQALQHTLGYEFRVHVDNDPARIIAGLHTYKYIASPLQVSTDVTEVSQSQW